VHTSSASESQKQRLRFPEHDHLTAELGEPSRRIVAGELADAAAAAQSLEDWLMTHMRTTDAALERCLEEEGIRGPTSSRQAP